MKGKKDNKKEEVVAIDLPEVITTKQELKAFLLSIRDELLTEGAPPVFGMSALNHILTMEKVYDLLDKDSKEIAQEIWVKLSQSGLQLKKPILLFAEVD